MRLETTSGTDLTKPVSAYDAPPSVIALPETLETSVTPASVPEAKISVADIYKEAYDTIKATPPTRYPTPKLWGTFPPYNKSFSEANELAIRWAHRQDVESGAQKAISYHGKWYLIEKFDSADLKYQIVDRLTDEEYRDFAKEYYDYDKSTAGEGQSLSNSTGSIGTLD